MKEVDAVRSQIEGLLGIELEEVLWTYLMDEGYIDLLLRGEIKLQQLADRLDTLQATLFEPTWKEEPVMLSIEDIYKPVERDLLGQVIFSHLVAIEAAKDNAVKDFRSSRLGSKLLVWEAVRWWILSRALEGQPATWWLTIPAPREFTWKILQENLEGKHDPQPALTLTVSAEQIASAGQFRFLRFGMPEYRSEYSVRTTAGGILEELRQLSEYLAKKYRWTEAQATLFVLTGLSPFISAITSEFEHNKKLSGVSQIVLAIDPALSPEEVAGAYRSVRQYIFSTRQRDMTEKHLMLAFFSAINPQRETWAELMRQWNNAYPQWRYKEESNFGRDCKQAQDRLLHPLYRTKRAVFPGMKPMFPTKDLRKEGEKEEGDEDE